MPDSIKDNWRAGRYLRWLAAAAMLSVLAACAAPAAQQTASTGQPETYCDAIRIDAALSATIKALNQPPTCKRVTGYKHLAATRLAVEGWSGNSETASSDPTRSIILDVDLYDGALTIADIPPVDAAKLRVDGNDYIDTTLAQQFSSPGIQLHFVWVRVDALPDPTWVCIFALKQARDRQLLEIDLCHPVGFKPSKGEIADVVRHMVQDDLPQIDIKG